MAKILIIDDELHIRELFRKVLKMEGFEVITAPTAGQSLEIISRQPIDLVLLDIVLQGESGLLVLKKIRQAGNKVPVIIYSAVITADVEKEAMALGASEVLSKDAGIKALIAQIKKYIKTEEPLGYKPSQIKSRHILLVDDEDDIRAALRIFFENKGYRVSEAASGECAIEIVRAEDISVVLLDVSMPGMDGLETLSEVLKLKPAIGVVMVTAMRGDERVKKAMKIGAYSYVLKPFDFLYLEMVVLSKFLTDG